MSGPPVPPPSRRVQHGAVPPRTLPHPAPPVGRASLGPASLGLAGWLQLLATAAALVGAVLARATYGPAFGYGASTLPRMLFVVGVLIGMLSLMILLTATLVPDAVERSHRLIAGVGGAVLAGALLVLLAVVGFFTLGSLLDLGGIVLAVPVLGAVGAGAALALLGGSHGRRRAGALLLAGGASAAVWFFASWWVLNALAAVALAEGLEPAGAQ